MNTKAVLFFLACSVLAGAAQAQQFPTRPMRFISPYPPGGGNDTLARILADKVGDALGQRMIVDNRPGANTIVGTEITAKAPPDGHTFILLPTSFVTNPAFYRKLPYDTERDFAPVALIALSPQMLVSHLSIPANNVKELVALFRAKPGNFSYSSSGQGSVGHLAAILFTMMTKTELVHVPYKGTAQAVTDLLGGHVPLMFSSMLNTLPHVRAGKLRIYGITSAKRSPALAEVPTIAEAGVPGYESSLWYGVLAPGKTPASTVQRLNGEFGKALKAPDVVEKLASQGVDTFYSTPEQFAARIKDEIPKWAKVIAASGVKAE